jgi:glycosyltransferase involved in cell wall biosynthesis
VKCTCTVVIPAYNERDSVETLVERLDAALTPSDYDWQALFVNDGSTDGTLDILRDLAAKHPTRVGYLSFSRNFGHEAATSAGLDHAEGDAVAIIDADLQDPPEELPAMLDRWQNGADVVYAQRRTRSGESPIKKLTAHLFYRLMRSTSDVDIPRDTGDFRVMDRRVVEAVRACRENPRFVRGLVSWVGFRQEAHLYDRAERFAGETKYHLRSLVRLSLIAMFGYSQTPLRATMWIGLTVVTMSMALGIAVAAERVLMGGQIPGYALLACGMFLLGGVQLTMLGVMAYYLGQVATAAQGRPLYIVAESHPASHPEQADGRDALQRDARAGADVLVVPRQTPNPLRADRQTPTQTERPPPPD